MAASVTIRNFHGAGMCHEILLANGTAIMLDPFIRWADVPEGTIETVKKVDYILLTHAHFDHDLDLGWFVEKFNCRVIAGFFSAMDLLKFHRVPYDNLIPVLPGEEYTFPEFKLHVLRAKHNNTGGRIYRPETDFAGEAVGVTGHVACDTWGFLESVDYCITANNNFRLLTASGESLWRNTARETFHPNLVIRQAGRRNGDMLTGEQVSPEELSELMLSYGAQVVIPAHYDVLIRRMGEDKAMEYLRRVKAIVERKDPSVTFIVPESCRFYRIGISVQ